MTKVSVADRVEAALQRFAAGCNCSQTVLTAYADELGLSTPLAMKIAVGFGGGMGRRAETCGTVTGAFMVLGLAFGAETVDAAKKELVYQREREFAASFSAAHGDLQCKHLLGCDLSTDEGREYAKTHQLTAQICPGLVRTAIEILEKMLSENHTLG